MKPTRIVLTTTFCLFLGLIVVFQLARPDCAVACSPGLERLDLELQAVRESGERLADLSEHSGFFQLRIDRERRVVEVRYLRNELEIVET